MSRDLDAPTKYFFVLRQSLDVVFLHGLNICQRLGCEKYVVQYVVVVVVVVVVDSQIQRIVLATEKTTVTVVTNSC